MSTFSLDRLLSFGSSGEREAEQARKGQKTAEELERLSVPEAAAATDAERLLLLLRRGDARQRLSALHTLLPQQPMMACAVRGMELVVAARRTRTAPPGEEQQPPAEEEPQWGSEPLMCRVPFPAPDTIAGKLRKLLLDQRLMMADCMNQPGLFVWAQFNWVTGPDLPLGDSNSGRLLPWTFSGEPGWPALEKAVKGGSSSPPPIGTTYFGEVVVVCSL